MDTKFYVSAFLSMSFALSFMSAEAQGPVGIVPEADQILSFQDRSSLLKEINFDQSTARDDSAAALDLLAEGILELKSIQFNTGDPSNTFLRLAGESGGINSLLSRQVKRSYFAQPGTSSADHVNIDAVLAFNTRLNELVVTPLVLNYTPSLVAGFVVHELAHSWNGDHIICEKGSKRGTTACDPYTPTDEKRPAPYRLQLDYLLALANDARNVSSEVKVNAIQVAYELATSRLNNVPDELISSIGKRSAEIQDQYRETMDNTVIINGKPLNLLMDTEVPPTENASSFSELNNNSIPKDGGDLTTSDSVSATSPIFTFSNFVTASPSPTPFSVPTNRYFQYRAIMESDDTSASCNYGGSYTATWCSPELQSVAVGPNHYDTSSPTIVNSTGVNFATLTSLLETLGTSGCGSGTLYNLSPDNTNWYYLNGSTWTLAGGTVATATAASSITPTALATFPSPGTIYFKVFLQSSGTSACTINSVAISGTQ